MYLIDVFFSAFQAPIALLLFSFGKELWKKQKSVFDRSNLEGYYDASKVNQYKKCLIIEIGIIAFSAFLLLGNMYLSYNQKSSGLELWVYALLVISVADYLLYRLIKYSYDGYITQMRLIRELLGLDT